MNLFFYFLISLAISIILPNLIKKNTLDNSLESQDQNIKKIKNKTPIMGGFIFIIPIFVYLIFTKNFKLLFWLIPSTIFGFYDDFQKIINKATSKGLAKSVKTIFLIVNYLLFGYIFNVDFSIKEFIYYILIYTGVLVTDGIDGLLGTLTLSFVILAKPFDQLKKIIFVSLIPFLYNNLNPAKIFMGDTGSSFLAALIYYLLLSSKQNYLGIIFLIGSISSLLQILSKKFIKKKILNFSPFHHNLETLGWNENQIVILYNLIYYLIFIYFNLNKI